jgi:hypothetical protein
MKLTASVIRFRVKTARKFFRFNKIDVAIEGFNELLSLPRKEQPTKKELTKQTWLDILMLARISSSRQHHISYSRATIGRYCIVALVIPVRS